MASGLKLVRKELGPDALILSTRTVRNGKLGLLGKPTIEITAAIDTNWPREENTTIQEPAAAGRPTSPSRIFGRTGSKKKRINTTVGGDDIQLDYSGNETSDDLNSKEARQLLTMSPTPKRSSQSTADTALRNEVDELKGLVQQLAAQLADKPAYNEGEEQGQDTFNSALRDRLSQMKPVRDPVSELLHRHGIEGEPARTIAAVAAEQLTQDDLKDKGKIRRFALRAIESLVEVRPPAFQKTKAQSRIALIGPTGVGKTTTLAKLAAHYLGNHSNSVAMITIDTYRIAAVEQLKVYGEIMHLPVDVVISPDQLEEAITRHSDKSLILIDTAGRSPRDTLCIEELTSFLRPHLEIEKHLVLSAATRENELLDTIHHFEKVGIDKTIFTKVDECMRTGVILNVQLQHQAPLSYITNGQRVPEDLLQITKRSVAELIMSHHEGIAHD
ncbi:flagellar biosynthesis protein FlhF [Desulfopila aestuarii DSM 18488]|uniref:Flagellar biosynthesis protein FlhF n=2 Tax=Desulfopila aestuarii TaxID=231440 RepID=A0A1M7YDN1_9BACT|nr:flagellar biosynthesis protein FlhF [Desulfopila aestuarii DSM 18488]